MPPHYQQQASIDEHLHHLHIPKGRASGGDFWGDVGNFFTHTLPEVATQVIPMALAAL